MWLDIADQRRVVEYPGEVIIACDQQLLTGNRMASDPQLLEQRQTSLVGETQESRIIQGEVTIEHETGFTLYAQGDRASKGVGPDETEHVVGRAAGGWNAVIGVHVPPGAVLS